MKKMVEIIAILSILLFASVYSGHAQDSQSEGVERSRLLNDLRSEVNLARRDHNVRHDISSAERACVSPASDLSRCRSAVDSARSALNAKLESAGVDKSSEDTTVVVEGSSGNNIRTRRLSNSPRNQPRKR